MAHGLTTRDYLDEFSKLDLNDCLEPGDYHMVNKLGYFIFDGRQTETYISSPYLLTKFNNADKIYIFGNYSYVYATLEALFEKGMYQQVVMLNIDINNWDNVVISWDVLSRFTNLKLLNIDGNNVDSHYIARKKFIPDITEHLPASLEALSIVNMLYYDTPFNQRLSMLNLKVIKLFSIKWNQSICGLPSGLETLIIKSGEFNQRMENLPGGLKHLILLSWKFTMPLDRLPHGLEYFAGLHFPSLNYLLGNYDKELTNLPSSIKSVLLDKNLFEKQGETLKSIYPECQIDCYDDFRYGEFIMKHLLEWMDC